MLDLFFTEKVVKLKAWQLYLGNGIWTFLVGLVLLIVAKILGMTGIHSSTLTKLLSTAGSISTGQNYPHHQLS
jgi:hypothetical protein